MKISNLTVAGCSAAVHNAPSVAFQRSSLELQRAADRSACPEQVGRAGSSIRNPQSAIRNCHLLAATGVALLLRMHCLHFTYLSLDEFVTLWSITGDGLGEMLNRALHWTTNGPLFLLCCWSSCHIAGDVVWGVKLPGVVCGTFCVWAIWWTTRKLFLRDDAAIVAAWFVAVAPHFVAFSQEARPYMPAALLVTLATGSLASWLRTGRRLALAATVLFSLLAVGFHLLAALALVAQNVAVIHYGLMIRWPRRRWMEWFVAQLSAAIGLWIVGIQFCLLSSRHGSLLLETKLPMPTQELLAENLGYEVRTEIVLVLVGLAIWWSARKFPGTTSAHACGIHGVAICTAAASYVVPTVLVSVLSALRVMDCWPRYYFLFFPGLMVAIAGVVVCLFPRHLSRWLAATIGLAMLCQYSWIGGLPSCRLNSNWMDFSVAISEMRRRLEPGELVLSRSGLVEANHISFLSDSTGASYLKCFLEAKDGALPAEHVPLPFSPESDSTSGYLEAVAREKLSHCRGFWLVNAAPGDFDYRHWVHQRFGAQFHKLEELRYSTLVLCRYVRNPEGDFGEVAASK